MEACLDILAGKFKVDECSSHDPLVLQCLVTSFGYERLLNDFGNYVQGSRLGLSTVLPPRERVGLNEAKDKRVSFLSGSLTLHAMFQLYGNKVLHGCPLRGFTPCLCTFSKSQRGLFDMHQYTICKMCDLGWKCGCSAM